MAHRIKSNNLSKMFKALQSLTRLPLQRQRLTLQLKQLRFQSQKIRYCPQQSPPGLWGSACNVLSTQKALLSLHCLGSIVNELSLVTQILTQAASSEVHGGIGQAEFNSLLWAPRSAVLTQLARVSRSTLIIWARCLLPK